MSQLSKKSPHKQYHLFAGDMFESMTTISAANELPQPVFLSGTHNKLCVGFHTIGLQHAIKGRKHLNLNEREIEVICTAGPVHTAAVVSHDKEKAKFLGSRSRTE